MRSPRRNGTALTLAAALCLAACSSGSSSGAAGSPSGSSSAAAPSRAAVPAPSRAASPKLKVEQVATGLQNGWDIGFLPDGKVLVTERPGRFTLLSSARPGGTATRVEANLDDVLAVGESGLMGMVIHPDFATTRRFTTCQPHWENSAPVDIRLVTWRLADDGRSATRERDLLTGLPINPGGRHSGCRPTLAADGMLLVGTGDTADGRVSQNRSVLGGKVLRLDLATGAPAPGNPFLTSKDPKERYVYTYGHRNVQGVAVRPDTGQVFTAEHGPHINDEVNVLRPGANYGWDPSQGGAVDGYDESVPMTDGRRFPDAVAAVWQSGETTEAICAAAFLTGDQWGTLRGSLVVTALKGAKLLILTPDRAGAVTAVRIPTEFTDTTYGRLRAARVGPDGALYVTTANESDDKLLRITPA